MVRFKSSYSVYNYLKEAETLSQICFFYKLPASAFGTTACNIPTDSNNKVVKTKYTHPWILLKGTGKEPREGRCQKKYDHWRRIHCVRSLSHLFPRGHTKMQLMVMELQRRAPDFLWGWCYSGTTKETRNWRETAEREAQRDRPKIWVLIPLIPWLTLELYINGKSLQGF